jgi:hydrogenase maturation protease
MRKIAVLGIGNILMTDDGIGVEVANRLADMSWPENVTIYDAGTAIMNMLDVFVNNDILIVIDALEGGHEPGSIYRLTPEQLGEWRTESLSLHDVQVLDILNMAALFNRHPEVIIYGIEPSVLALNLGLSEKMQAQLPVLLELVRQELTGLVENS